MAAAADAEMPSPPRALPPNNTLFYNGREWACTRLRGRDVLVFPNQCTSSKPGVWTNRPSIMRSYAFTPRDMSNESGRWEFTKNGKVFKEVGSQKIVAREAPAECEDDDALVPPPLSDAEWEQKLAANGQSVDIVGIQGIIKVKCPGSLFYLNKEHLFQAPIWDTRPHTEHFREQHVGTWQSAGRQLATHLSEFMAARETRTAHIFVEHHESPHSSYILTAWTV